MGFNALILTTIGARTGAERTNPVGWFPGPDGSWLIVASAAGAARNPAWYHNIAAHPDKVKIEVDGLTVPVTAEQLHGAERDQAWQQVTAAAPRFAQYPAQDRPRASRHPPGTRVWARRLALRPDRALGRRPLAVSLAAGGTADGADGSCSSAA